VNQELPFQTKRVCRCSNSSFQGELVIQSNPPVCAVSSYIFAASVRGNLFLRFNSECRSTQAIEF